MVGFFDWDSDVAKRELLEAMRLNPQYSWAPHWHGLLMSPYSLDEAMIYVTRARDLDPLSPILSTGVGVPLHQHRRYHEAIQIYSNVIESESKFAPAYYYMGLSYEQLGEHEEAFTWLERAMAERNGWLWTTPVEPRFDPVRDTASWCGSRRQ